MKKIIPFLFLLWLSQAFSKCSEGPDHKSDRETTLTQNTQSHPLKTTNDQVDEHLEDQKSKISNPKKEHEVQDRINNLYSTQ